MLAPFSSPPPLALHYISRASARPFRAQSCSFGRLAHPCSLLVHRSSSSLVLTLTASPLTASPLSASPTMARLNVTMSAAATICFLALVCIHVDAQMSYAPEMAPQGAPMMAPEGAPTVAPVTPPMMAPEMSPGMAPVESPMAPTSAAGRPGPMPAPASSASTLVPSAAFAVLSVAAFFLH